MEEQDREKVRSPNYPAFSLPAAIERARAFHRANGKAAVPTISAVKAWGYTSLNGRALRALGAMRQYGLVEDTGPKMVRLSQVGLTLVVAPDGSPERAKALREAAGKPSIFAQLFDQYSDGFPSDEAMVANLEINSPYSGDAARSIVSHFRDTLALVNPPGGAISPSTPKVNSPNTAEESERQRDTDQTPKKPQETPMPESGRQTLDFPFPLITGGQAVLRLPRSMTEPEFAHFQTLLTSMLTGIKMAIVTASPPVTPAVPAPTPNGDDDGDDV